jgi:hypothetical protein
LAYFQGGFAAGDAESSRNSMGRFCRKPIPFFSLRRQGGDFCPMLKKNAEKSCSPQQQVYLFGIQSCLYGMG